MARSNKTYGGYVRPGARKEANRQRWLTDHIKAARQAGVTVVTLDNRKGGTTEDQLRQAMTRAGLEIKAAGENKFLVAKVKAA